MPALWADICCHVLTLADSQQTPKSQMTIPTYDTAGVIVSISEEKLAGIQAAFSKVHYHPDGVVPDDHLAEVDIWFTSWTGLPASVTHVKQIPRTKVIQLSSGQSLREPMMTNVRTGADQRSGSQQLARERYHAVQRSKGSDQGLLGIR
jgi:hypothetical protein